MKVKKVELFGFKSFADKTEILLNGQGITAIVGPNGCGKTNITDAMRWVLGEQKARSLRGVKMDDVIFKGAGTRKPLGMAEVSLTLSNDERRLPVDFEEVIITRRVFKSGESQYFINNSKCRLKDIVELFLDTGMGSNSYSLIEQKMIDSVLSENDEERRDLFEQVAGIKKYKVRRKETIGRLENTDNDLNRISDLIIEVEKKVVSLKRQSQRAMRYKALTEEKKEVELKVAAISITNRLDKLNPLNEKHKNLKDTLEKLLQDNQQDEVKLVEIRKKLQQKDNEQRNKQSEIDKLNQKIQKTEDQILVYSERRKNSLESIDKYKKDIEYYKEQTAKSGELIEKRENDLEIIEDVLEDLNENISKKQSFLDEINKKLSIFLSQKNNVEKEIRETEKEVNEKDKLFEKIKFKLTDSKEKQKESRSKIKEILEKIENKQKEEEGIKSKIKNQESILKEKNEFILRLKKK